MIASAVVVTVATCGLILAQGRASASAEATKAIAAANRRFGDAVAHGDAATISDIYTTSAELLPPGQTLVKGRSAIKAFWASTMKSMTALTLTTVEVECADDIAIERGIYFMKTANGQSQGKYLVVWKHTYGKWMLHRDCWNSDGP